ncbi:MAG: DNA polymerase III subunit gamma/tau [Sphingobacteriales bacterium]|jgi:DNA polymerase-3 subunit gamma/tau|nr:DNA polymerase III subunit gamma/tau [Sphingobacteriales bacterium]MBP9140820.1 DNA polymerase III subunit gamma/tau [Chitinophagales bacterium]MDA0198360.1 DNA polymerase III subunit gamma/tau [Bacteroidota bacterium]MBK6891198.1 DNA polymerase III subunit gamma/tau [Sphingobacteriales bacterium]MBK7526977.1 DNA polymerase III subunit gamma/tau [Sphingobacteriales bacterium]
MAFIVSARKYRPMRFADVVGQQHVTTTLKNAIKNQKLAQSFLFTGPRGVGKTTCARILAKVLNCLNPTPDFEPCNECQACESFNKQASLNIFELDAASNNSVDDIRNLIEQVRFAPQFGRYKIYIIDEVHMLSQAAFNAFLKTLEEPPAYAIFILATTEKHKIIPTILSRCQIFDFTRITVADMAAHLQKICTDQQITAEPDALHIIAQKADGGLRDALSMFDRIASYTEGSLTYTLVIQSLNVLDYDYFFKATDYLLTTDLPSLMLLFDAVLQNGFEGDHFMLGLAEHIRNLLVCQQPDTIRLLEAPDTIKAQYINQAAVAPTAFLLNCLQIANECDVNYRTAKNKRLQVELALMKMCYVNAVVKLQPTSTSTEPNAKPLVISDSQHQQASLLQEVKPKYNAKNPDPDKAKHIEPTPPPPSELLAIKNTNFLENAKNASLNLPGQTPNKININAPSVLPQPPTTTDNPQLPPTQKIIPTGPDIVNLWNTFVTLNPGFNQAIASTENESLTLKSQGQVLSNRIKQKIEDFKDYIVQQGYTCTGWQFVVEVDDTATSEANQRAALYHPKDKLKAMATQNPEIQNLINRFSLEINYD